MQVNCWLRGKDSPLAPPRSVLKHRHRQLNRISIRRAREYFKVGLWGFSLHSPPTTPVFPPIFLRVLMIRRCFGITRHVIFPETYLEIQGLEFPVLPHPRPRRCTWEHIVNLDRRILLLMSLVILHKVDGALGGHRVREGIVGWGSGVWGLWFDLVAHLICGVTREEYLVGLIHEQG